MGNLNQEDVRSHHRQFPQGSSALRGDKKEKKTKHNNNKKKHMQDTQLVWRETFAPFVLIVDLVTHPHAQASVRNIFPLICFAPTFCLFLWIIFCPVWHKHEREMKSSERDIKDLKNRFPQNASKKRTRICPSVPSCYFPCVVFTLWSVGGETDLRNIFVVLCCFYPAAGYWSPDRSALNRVAMVTLSFTFVLYAFTFL